MTPTRLRPDRPTSCCSSRRRTGTSQSGQPPIAPRFLRMVAYGGPRSAERMIREAGLDMASAEFWKGGFEVLRGITDELEGL